MHDNAVEPFDFSWCGAWDMSVHAMPAFTPECCGGYAGKCDELLTFICMTQHFLVVVALLQAGKLLTCRWACVLQNPAPISHFIVDCSYPMLRVRMGKGAVYDQAHRQTWCQSCFVSTIRSVIAWSFKRHGWNGDVSMLMALVAIAA